MPSLTNGGIMAERKKVKVVGKEGAGAPPGYKWSVHVLDRAYDEAVGFLSKPQYQHLALQVQELARQKDPTRSDLVDVRSIEAFHEIRDKGGVLGSLNVRVFFSVDKDDRSILILGAIKKQNNGPTPLGDKVRMRRRLRKFKNGDFGTISD